MKISIVFFVFLLVETVEQSISYENILELLVLLPFGYSVVINLLVICLHHYMYIKEEVLFVMHFY